MIASGYALAMRSSTLSLYIKDLVSITRYLDISPNWNLSFSNKTGVVEDVRSVVIARII